MKQFNKRKLSVVVALLMCMILAFGSTFAYLTDTTSKINTVTIGKVDIDVVEDLWSQLPDTDGDGIPDIAEEVIPNQTVTKDPSIKNTGNNDAYVYLSVEVPNKVITSFNPDGTKVNGGAAADTDLFSYEINNGWTLIGSKTEAGKTIYTYGYESPLAPGAETPTLFDSVTVVNTNEGQGLEETLQEIVIHGYAIQSDEVENNLTGWNIINNQAGLGTTALSNLLIPGPEFNATIPAAATTVAFVDDIAPAAYTFENGKLLDVSDAQDTGVVSWYDEASTTYYVSTQRDGLTVFANPDSSEMFREKSISSIDFQNLKTDLVENLLNTFRDCSSISSLDLSLWNTPKLKTLKNTFSNCTNLTSITFGTNFTTESVENMGFMFYGSSALKNLDLSGFSTKNVTYIKSAFNGCTNLTDVIFGDKFILDNAVDMSYMFNNCQSLTELDLDHWRSKKATLMTAMFQKCYNLKTLKAENWDTSSCENMDHLLHYCESLENFDASKWNVGNVKTFASMFSECEKLNYFSTKNWNTSSCETMRFMFYNCKSFKRLDCEDWDVRKVQSFDHFLAHSNMENFDVSKWNVTSECENLNAIFHSTRETYIDVTGWDTSNVIAFNQLCDGMYYLEKIDGLETWNTSKGVCFAELFHGCGSLKEANLSSFDTRNANEGTPISTNGDVSYGLEDLFTGCGSLEKLILSENFTRFGNGEVRESYYANFPTPASGYWYNAETGQAYAPNEIPDLTAATYVSTQP